MKKILQPLLLLLATSFFKRIQTARPGNTMELTRLKMALTYVQFVKTFRLLVISFLGLGLCMIFLFVGLVLLYVSLFLYAPWSAETKLLVGVLCAAVYLLATLFILWKVFASRHWLEIFHAEAIAAQLQKEAAPKEHLQPIEQH